MKRKRMSIYRKLADSVIALLVMVLTLSMHRVRVLLECVMLSFSMAIQNIGSFHAIEEMGSRDSLTGLKNRNCYQNDLLNYEK